MRRNWFGRVLTAAAAATFCFGIALAQEKPKATEEKPAVKAEGAKEKGDKPAAETKAQTEIGKPAPNFELVNAIDGKKVKLSDLKDKIVVLEWFNYECPVCKKAMPAAMESAEKYGKKGVVWLAIDSTHFRTAEQNAKFAKEKGIAYPILMDNDGTIGHTYGAKTTPHMFIINKGTLVYMGGHDNAGKGEPEGGLRNYVNEALDAVLAGKPVPVAETKNYGCSIKYRSKQD